jgi:hypothetical protein
MGAPREVTRSGWAGRESDDAHAHYAIPKNYSCLTYTNSLQVTHVLCVCVCVYGPGTSYKAPEGMWKLNGSNDTQRPADWLWRFSSLYRLSPFLVPRSWELGTALWLIIDKYSCDTDIDSETDTEDVVPFMPNFVSLLCS